MTDFPFALVGFDLDGTLLDTSPELTAAVNHTLGRAGHPPFTLDEVKPMIGLGAKHMLKMGLEKAGMDDPEALETWLPVLLDYYGDNLGSGSPPFPGLIDAMNRLDALGVRMAVVTNKYERFAVKLLTAIGMADRFTCIIGGDTMGRGKSKPHRAPIDEMIRRSGGVPGEMRAAFIGDSIYDTGAARAAGIPSIAVSFGFLHQPVEELGADAIIDHYDELIPTLERLAAKG
ncbi:MAG: HAD hydrolase-like protein [Blastomonas sp.]